MTRVSLQVASNDITQRILLVRGRKVMVDADLARLYGVSTSALNQAVKRNPDRFPPDFMFRLSSLEKREVVTHCDHLARLRFSSALPTAFTEHGALMLGNVLKSPRAAEVSLLVVRAFVQMREMLAMHKEVAEKLDELERKVSQHDKALAGLIDAVRQLMKAPEPTAKPIGFTADMGRKRRI